MGVPVNFRVWTPEMTQRLKELWWAGDRLETIALKIGAPSMKSVKRKVEREGFKRNPSVRDLPVRPLHLCELHKHKKEPAPKLRPGGKIICMLNVSVGECRWMSGDPSAAAQLCGNPIVRGSYCAHHSRRAYQGA